MRFILNGLACLVSQKNNKRHLNLRLSRIRDRFDNVVMPGPFTLSLGPYRITQKVQRTRSNSERLIEKSSSAMVKFSQSQFRVA